MDSVEVKKLLDEALSLEEVHVKGEGSHYEVIAVDACFDGMNRVKKQQLIYGPLWDHIQSNEIHAIQIKAYTPAEWARDKKLMSL
ncbi:BolA family iron metabolism protein IbaG [Vibrio sp. SCSIO 43136]|uniref:BolA family iron metabolism protein IbaG n=1 Tax=Vibrio sp. SCSIO 43136 TaxID=2819101 RepID=UPI00207538C4|nr:BolA family iron metabolism protein IbaG [Vibrio sp. SCSIO 43136]USD64987.1 BolA family iron metabolism protein IbaG [Vibrio sp. SCSIO 43136]